ncbi:MAG: phosphatidylinositol kinase, partial [Actinomycetota bacterium]|nr:phosphatidylinositol kinase [Actinomycetota bacterium]
IWTFAGEPLDARTRRELESLGEQIDGALGSRLSTLLSKEETAATLERIEGLLLDDIFPAPAGDRPLPWPLV